MSYYAIGFIEDAAPRHLNAEQHYAWVDGYLCATVLFNTQAEAEVDGYWRLTSDYGVYLAGRKAGANAERGAQ